MNGVNTPAPLPLPTRTALCLLGAFLLCAAPALPQSTLEDGLQIYYPFAQAEDGALDASGNGRHGTLIGTSWCNEGHLAGSRHLGQGSYINAGNEVNFASWPQYSISVWFRHDLSAGDPTGYGDKLFCKSALYSDQYIRMLPSRDEYAYGFGAINFTVSTPDGGFEREFYDATVLDAVRIIRTDVFRRAGGFDEELHAGEDWDLDRRIRRCGAVGRIRSVMTHHEDPAFRLRDLTAKTAYYAPSLERYIARWGRDDPEVRRQFGWRYRFFTVFVEQGKWRRLLAHPCLAVGMLSLKLLMAATFVLSRPRTNRERMNAP